MDKYLTKEGLEKLKKELDYLVNTKRKEVAEKMKKAVSFGDLSENAEYDAAREELGFMEKRIKELKETVAQAKIVESKNSGKVEIGSTVFISSNNGKQKFQVVSPEEADIIQEKISFESPLGKALMDKQKGDKVVLDTPGGQTEYKVIKIE